MENPLSKPVLHDGRVRRLVHTRHAGAVVLAGIALPAPQQKSTTRHAEILHVPRGNPFRNASQRNCHPLEPTFSTTIIKNTAAVVSDAYR